MTSQSEQELARAIAHGLGDPAARGDGTAHAALLAMLRRVEPPAAVKDIEALVLELLGVDIAAQTSSTVLPSVYEALKSVSEDKAAAILAERTRQHPFGYDDRASPGAELAEFVDARLNAVLVKHLMRALNAAIENGEMTLAVCSRITDGISADSRNRTNPVYLSALERTIARTQAGAPGTSIVYLSLGCGSGREDVGIVAALRRKFPSLDIEAIGFDPFQKDAAGNLIVTELDGMLVNRELRPGETFPSLVRAMCGKPDAVIVATERYALHHMRLSPARLMRELEGAALVSVEEPVTALQRESVHHRLAASGYDILVNHALEQCLGGSWISEARENPELFGSLYRRLEDLQAQQSSGVVLEKVAGVFPPTYVITYPARGARA
jgi:hypothetical protein